MSAPHRNMRLMPLNDDHAKKLAACNVLVDALVAAGDARTTIDRDAVRMTFARVLDDQIVTATRTADGYFQLDLTPLLYGSLDLLTWLVRTLADHADVEPMAVIINLRDQVHDWTHPDTIELDEPDLE